MENASKALIIAGAILLAILIISLGIMIYNQAAGVVNSNAMSEAEAAQFNQKFTQYEGARVKGSTVNSMMQSVMGNNTSQDDDARRINVMQGANEILKKDATSVTKVATGKVFKVECSYGTNGSNKGLVKTITITEASV